MNKKAGFQKPGTTLTLPKPANKVYQVSPEMLSFPVTCPGWGRGEVTGEGRRSMAQTYLLLWEATDI